MKRSTGELLTSTAARDYDVLVTRRVREPQVRHAVIVATNVRRDVMTQKNRFKRTEMR